MQTLMLDGSRYSSSREFHEALQKMLSLPAWYGMNADAFHDCLSERAEPISLWILSYGEEDVAKAIRLIVRVVLDLGGRVREL